MSSEHDHHVVPSKPTEEKEELVAVEVQEPAKVILFNDDIHTFDEVIEQLMKATKCDTGRAESLTWEVHSRGKAAVFEGVMDECLRVVSILEEIALHTHIEM